MTLPEAFMELDDLFVVLPRDADAAEEEWTRLCSSPRRHTSISPGLVGACRSIGARRKPGASRPGSPPTRRAGTRPVGGASVGGDPYARALRDAAEDNGVARRSDVLVQLDEALAAGDGPTAELLIDDLQRLDPRPVGHLRRSGADAAAVARLYPY